MIFLPAIDIRGGRCVRLSQGDFGRETVYGDDPVEMARRWKAEGAEWVHVVDLDGARDGVPQNRRLIEAIAGEVGVRIELGGGIRDVATAKGYLAAGVERVVLGSVLVKNPAEAEAILREPACRGRAALGIDAKDGKVAIDGWTALTAWTAAGLVERYRSWGPAAVIYTDIGRDGMLSGPNLEATRALAGFCRPFGIGVILSGGISTLEDLRAAKALEPGGVTGVISGRAIYTGGLQVAEAARILRG